MKSAQFSLSRMMLLSFDKIRANGQISQITSEFFVTSVLLTKRFEQSSNFHKTDDQFSEFIKKFHSLLAKKAP